MIETEQWLQPAALTQALKRELHALSADEGREELSLRGIYYRLVERGWIENSPTGYRFVESVLNR